MVGGFKAAYNDLQGDVDPRATFLISDTFADGKFGVLFSAAYAQRSLVEEGQSTVRWDLGSSVGGFNAANSTLPAGVTMAQVNNAFHPRIPRYGRLTHDQDRLGLTTSLQFRPNEKNLFNLDVLYSDFNAKRDEDFLEAFSFSRNAAQGGKPQTAVRDAEIGANGTLVYGLFDDVDIRSEARHDELETMFYSVALSRRARVQRSMVARRTGRLLAFGLQQPDPDHRHARSLQQRRLLVRLPRQQPAAGLQLQLRCDQCGQLELRQLLGGGYSSEIRLRPQGVDNTFQVAKVDLKFAPTDNRKFKLGLDYKKYDFVSWEQRRASETTVPAAARRHDAGQHDRAAQGIR